MLAVLNGKGLEEFMRHSSRETIWLWIMDKNQLH